jgi:ABC-type phosphate transport system substrate-binding protein
MLPTRPLLLLALLLAVPVHAQVEVAVIAHPEVAADSLSKSELLDFYTGDIERWPDGAQVLVTDLSEKGPVRDRFYEFLDKRPSRLKSIWLRNMLSGEGEPPESVATEAAMLERVAGTPGALGFVGRAQVSEAVKVLLLIVTEAESTDR